MQQGNDKPATSETGNVASIVPNLSNLGCGVPAATRIEMYSSGNGHAHSVLEATFYTCDKHTAPAVEAIEETGLTAHPMALGEDPYRAKCGAGFDFTAAKAARSADEGEQGLSNVETPAPASSQVQVGPVAEVPDLYRIGCGRPATTHIEIYSPNPGDLTGDLQVSYYVCAQHTGDAVAAVAATGFTAVQIPPTAHCGAGYDFTDVPRARQLHAPGRAVEANLIVKAAAAWLRTVDPAPVSQEMAKRMLEHWWHEPEMTIQEHEQALALFAEGAEGTDQKGSVFERTPVLGSSQVQVEEQPKEEPTSFNALVEAYRLGQAYGARLSDETLELLARLDARLRDAAEGHEKAHADGYVDGLSAAIEDGRIHAFTVEAAEEPDKFRWLCGCRWVTYQYPAGTEQVPIQQRLMEHVAEATAVDARTARALDADTCSCPPEVGDHRHLLYFRHPISGGKVHEIVVDSLWLGERMELLCWPLSVQGVALAARWVGEYAAQWDDGSPVVAEDLRRRAARWLR